jgi:hypothetical protein
MMLLFHAAYNATDGAGLRVRLGTCRQPDTHERFSTSHNCRRHKWPVASIRTGNKHLQGVRNLRDEQKGIIPSDSLNTLHNRITLCVISPCYVRKRYRWWMTILHSNYDDVRALIAKSRQDRGSKSVIQHTSLKKLISFTIPCLSCPRVSHHLTRLPIYIALVMAMRCLTVFRAHGPYFQRSRDKGWLDSKRSLRKMFEFHAQSYRKFAEVTLDYLDIPRSS